MVQMKKCTDPAILTEINETYLALKKEAIKTLDENLPGYIRKANEYKNMIDTCAR